MKLKKTKQYVTPENLFLFISTSGIICFFVYAFFYGKDMLIWMISCNSPSLWGMDFFHHIRISGYAGNIYSMDNVIFPQWGCFPPCIYGMYYFFYCIIKDIHETSNAVDMHYLNNFIFTLYSCIVYLILFLSINVICQKNINKNKAYILFFILFFSAPIIGSAFLAGNSVMIVLVFLIFFFHLRSSESKIYNEISIILLCICISFKIYPAIFIFLYLKEKRYHEIIRIILYGSIMFFVPFVFFGGMEAMKSWISNIISVMSEHQLYRIQYIKGISQLLLFKLSHNSESTIISLISTIISFSFLILMIFLSWKSKNQNRTIFFLCCAMIFFPSNAWRYSLCYLAIPLILWFIDKNKTPTKENWIIATYYGLIFSIPIWFGLLTKFKLHFYGRDVTYVDVWLYSVSYLFLLIEIIIEIRTLCRKPLLAHCQPKSPN